MKGVTTSSISEEVFLDVFLFLLSSFLRNSYTIYICAFQAHYFVGCVFLPCFHQKLFVPQVYLTSLLLSEALGILAYIETHVKTSYQIYT